MNCPFCAAAAPLHTSAPDYNRKVSSVMFQIHRCSACGLLFIANPPQDLGRYYEDGYHALPEDAQALDQHLAFQKFKLDILKKFKTNGEVLEIGPSVGVFARLVQKAGFSISTIEMDERCGEFLQQKLNIGTTISGDPAAVLRAGTTTYDAICLWHAIEHMPAPWQVLREAAQHLNPGGVLIIAAPNPDAWQARVMGRRWPHYDTPRHLFLLPIPWLKNFAEVNGLELALATTCDEGSLYWNRFSWATLFNLGIGQRFWGRLLWRAGLAFARLTNLWEGRENRGAAYTVVLRLRNS